MTPKIFNPLRESARAIRVGYEVQELFAEASYVPTTSERPEHPMGYNHRICNHRFSGDYDVAMGRDGRVVTVYHPTDKDDE